MEEGSVMPTGQVVVGADINANYGNRTLCCRGPWRAPCPLHAPLASLSLAGQEHGRTIPLPDIGPAHFKVVL